MIDHSQILSKTLSAIYPLIILVSIYSIVNGSNSPGGGFQGGAIFASIYICKYLILPIKDMSLKYFKKIEKYALILIILLPITFLYMQINQRMPQLNSVYLVVMNLLIGIKVACGMTIIFIRFVYYENQ